MIRSHLSHISHTGDTTQTGGGATASTGTTSQHRPGVRVLAVIRSDGSRFKLVEPVTPNQLQA